LIRGERGGDAPLPDRPSGRRGAQGHFIFYLLVFGFIGFLFGSAFPIALGLFLALADSRLIEWVLQTLGILSDDVFDGPGGRS
jgi:hypothetical protein